MGTTDRIGGGNRTAFRFPTPKEALEFTGERYVSGLVGDIQSEHYHRYLMALRYCVGKDVLDVASGEGYGAALLGQAARSVVGVDIDAASVRFANLHYLTERVAFRQGDATRLPIEDSSVDVVVSFETLEHIADHAAFLREVRRVLRPDGLVVISSPDRHVYTEEASHENPFHLKELDRAEFLSLMRGWFREVVLLEQRALTGSVIARTAETGADAPLEGFTTADGTLFERTVGLPASPYLVAVASDAPLPPVPTSVMQTPVVMWKMEEMRQRAERAAAEARQAGEERVAEARKASEERVAEAHRTLDAQARELAAVRRELDRYAEEARQVAARAAALEEAAAVSTESASEALRHQRQRIAQLEVESAHTRAVLAQAEANLKAVTESTSWRMTGPIRTVLARHPALARWARRGARATWWTVTGQLPARLRQRRELLRAQASQQAAVVAAAAPPPDVAPVDPQEAWGRYAPLAARLRARRVQGGPYPAPAMVSLTEAEVAPALAALRLPQAERPVVSIIVPVFNNLKLTAECLLSVARHTDDAIPFEVIVSDDGSTDATAELLPRVEGLRYRRNPQNLHFLRNCNAAAAEARGEFVLFLNNDVQVTEGWLPPLVEVFRSRPAVGAAGSRILYPDGYLQEAGVRIRPDGESVMLGLGEDPGLPQHNFARPVDYCSGAALIVRRERFLQSGGFWDELAPAYCEDLELCLRLGAEGLATWYVPQSVVVHHLSRTTAAGGDDAKMAMIVRNRQKVAERWQERIDALNQVRLFAFYLPQFHPIPENDRWWGAGFTEWTNVSRATPMYPGHRQPMLPADLGFYDLRLPGVMAEQAALARRYGIEGFCFYYYWFAGKRLLETPVDAMLASGEPDFPFMLCWANENWSRRWDGRDQEVLIGQSHSPEDDEAVIRDLMRYMRDRRYARVDGKPILLVYRVDLFPEFALTAARWRAACRSEGIGEIFLVAVESMELSLTPFSAAAHGCDASVQFPPHGSPPEADLSGRPPVPGFAGRVLDYEAAALHFLDRPWPAAPRFPGVMPGWDNTPRRMERATIFDGATPGAFQAWLEETIRQTRAHNAPGQRFVFLNAWNEWAEGAQLEPDQDSGHARLEAVRNALLGADRPEAP